jgi:hypothetical protein
MKGSSLELGAEKIEEEHQFCGRITWQSVLEFHKAIVITTIRSFVITKLPENWSTISFEMQAWASKLCTARGAIGTHEGQAGEEQDHHQGMARKLRQAVTMVQDIIQS